jgi:Flp pilus assembly pilin Flp
MKELVKKFLSDESGLETVEYALVGGLILVVAVAMIAAVGEKVNGVFTALDTKLGTVPTGG